MLLPPSVGEFVKAKHLSVFVLDLVQRELDLSQIEANTAELPWEMSADAGYCSEPNTAAVEEREVRGCIATGRQEHGDASATSRAGQGPRTTAMRARLRRGGWIGRYRLRGQTVEPVFGHIRERRGFRRLSVRALSKVRGEWSVVCTAHNLMKLAARRRTTSR